MACPVRLFERAVVGTKTSARIDTKRGLIKDVKVVGLVSKTRKRRYDPKALEEAASMYEGVKVNINHPGTEKDAGRPRHFHERFGVLRNVRYVKGKGLRGDLKYNPKHSEARTFAWWAKEEPTGIALSHNADGVGVLTEDGWTEIKKITRVRSVDLVPDGGTNETLFEGALIDQIEGREKLDKMRETTRMAMELIHAALYGPGPDTVEERRKAAVEVLGEWESVLSDRKKLSKVKKEPVLESEEPVMDLKGLTLDDLKTGRPDLYDQVLLESAKAGEQKRREQTLLETRKENDELKVRLALIERKDLVDRKLKDAKLPAAAVTETFRTTLMEAADESAVDDLIRDRVVLFESAARVRSNGTGPDGAPLTTGRLTKDDLVAAVKG